MAGVELYTTNEPCMAKDVQYKGMILVSKNKYTFGDIGSGFKDIKMSEIRDELVRELKEKTV